MNDEDKKLYEFEIKWREKKLDRLTQHSPYTIGKKND